MTKWHTDNLNWRTYCMQKSSLDGLRYYFVLQCWPSFSLFLQGYKPEDKHFQSVMMVLPAALL
jgi:hypothetical protein